MAVSPKLEIETTTVYRVRIAHTHTLKDGWRLSETTVEATGIEVDFLDLKGHMEAAYVFGLEEAKRRNKSEREYNRGLAPNFVAPRAYEESK